ncbi:chemoreceptor glutamine deamidase CheD [Methylomonas sp. MS20]|uniref:chemoreceptor glutamine deamidase CheD n=1 Tax=Methylomonas sp. MS20 TaxID=3418769 RepID=UPI003D02DF94
MTADTLALAPIQGFEHINRYWDRQRGIQAAKLLPGDYYVTDRAELITTVLGACVAACVYCPGTGAGGMNHFMLPHTDHARFVSPEERCLSRASRYGNFAMEFLINGVLRHGGCRRDLQVKLFGGASVVANLGGVGVSNVEFVLAYVEREGMALVSYDLGGVFPRKIVFDPRTGSVKLKNLEQLTNDTIVRRESSYQQIVNGMAPEGSVELFTG